MMYLNISILLIVLSFICIKLINSEVNSNKHESSKPGYPDCYEKMPVEDSGFMPIPFQGNFLRRKSKYQSFRDLQTPYSRPQMIRPDKSGYLLFKHNTTYKMGCSENGFLAPSPLPYSEVKVVCVNGSLTYEGKPYTLDEFKCEEIPKAKLVSTSTMCQDKEFHEIMKIGFQSRDTFLNLYRLCFNTKLNYTSYAWYYVESPICDHNQIAKVKPNYIKSKESCDINIDDKYKEITGKLGKAVKTESLLDAYKEGNKSRPFVIPVHLIAENEFVSVAEQHATYFYENTAPQWFTFNDNYWKDFEKFFRRNLAKGTGRHLIVAGTFLPSARLDFYKGRKPLFPSLPTGVNVPEYFWKMDYDLTSKASTVYIGVNNPYKDIHEIKHICTAKPCPVQSLSHKNENTKLFYCCSRESFEKMNGRLDAVVYRRFY